MRRILPFILIAGCATGESEEQLDPTSYDPPVTCDWESPGPDMLEGTIEGEQDFPATLASLDLTTVPDPIDLSGLDPFPRGLINWMVGRRTGRELSHADAQAAGAMGDAVLASFASGSFDLGVLREGLQYSYHCSRPLPVDLDALRARYGDYEGWALTDVPCGTPKDERRMVWAHPEQKIVVAETVTEDGSVRETEVLFMDTRDDGQLDFAAYNWNGKLMDRSTFATMGGRPTTFGTPYICISCHMGQSNIDIQHPTGTGAGCRD